MRGACLLVLAAACAQRSEPAAAGSGRPPLMRHVEALAAMNGRKAYSPDEDRAADYVTKELTALGLAARAQPFGDSQNVHALLRGTHPERCIVVGAHIDHLGPGRPGADDNASGIAGLIGVAQRWVDSRRTPLVSVVFVAFGAEEVGMHGSRMFAEAPPCLVAAMINLDMIGRSPFMDWSKLAPFRGILAIGEEPAVGILGDDGVVDLARRAAGRAGLRPHRLHDFPAFAREPIERALEGRSDHAAFQARGIPWVFFSTGIHDDYHQATDTADRIDPDVLERVTEAAYLTSVALAEKNVAP